MLTGLGETLYESADIAFDTVRGMFFNPKTNVDYGPTAPSGGWPISWYQGDNGSIQVPVGPGGVAQTQAQADQIKQTVSQQLYGPATPTVQGTTQGAHATSWYDSLIQQFMNYGDGTATATGSSGTIMGFPTKYVLLGGGGLLLAYMMFGRHGGRR